MSDTVFQARRKREAGTPILMMAALFLGLAPVATCLLLDQQLRNSAPCVAPLSCRTTTQAFAAGFAGSMDRR